MTNSSKSGKRNRPTNYKPFLIVSLVFATIVVASVIIGYFLTKEENVATDKEVEQYETVNTTKLESIKTPIEGTWVSNYDGAILGINGLTFSLDLPSVDAPTTLKGTISIEQNLVTFVNEPADEICTNIEGHYKFSFKEDEISFELIKDNCVSRTERMTMSWFKL